jgi:hypothetical protein
MLRGAIGMGLTWAVAWFGAGMILGRIIGPIDDDVPLPIVFGMFGFMSGVAFSGVLKLVAGRRRFDELSLGSFSGWGALGGLLVSALLAATAGPGGQPLIVIPAFALTGAASAAGTLLLARKAEAQMLPGGRASLDSADGAAGH